MDILSFEIETADQFWEELDEIAARDYHSTSLVERGLSSILTLTSLYLDQFLATDQELIKFVSDFIKSNIFRKSRGYIRRKLISLLLLEGNQLDIHCQLFVGAILLIDGRDHVSTLEMIQEEAGTNVVLHIMWEYRCKSARLNRIFLELLYEICKVQKLQRCDLAKISPEVTKFLFSLIEEQDDYDNDPHGFAAIKVLLALNEQFMIQALHVPDEDKEETDVVAPLRNMTFDVLKSDMNKYRAFGENIVVFFNRVADRCLQLMMMKFLYLIFTTKETYQYIYLNDLKVLADIIIRELYDISSDEEVLRHTYLRILYPLLRNTQLREDPYKREEIIMVLEQIAYPSTPSFSNMSETTQRLAARCLMVDWLEWQGAKKIPEMTIELPITRPSSATTIDSNLSLESRSSSLSEASDDSSRLHVVGLVAEDSHLRNYCPTRPTPPPSRSSPVIHRKSSAGYFSFRYTGSDVDISTLSRMHDKLTLEPSRTYSPCPPPPLPRSMKNRLAPVPPPPRRPRTATPTLN